jgi:hypothetical protein
MTLRASVVIALAVSGCGSSSNECSEARRAAAIAVTSAELWAQHDVDKAITAAAEARHAFEQLKVEAAKLDTKLRLVEESMGCFGAANCCQEIARFTADEKYGVYTTAMGLWQVMTPVQVEEIVTPLKETLNAADHLAQMTSSEAIAWCSSVRGSIARTRKLTPSAWTRAMFQASRDVDHANERISSERHRLNVISAWADAVRTKGHAPAPVLDNNGYLFTNVDSARYRVELYVETCVAGAQVASK